MRTLILGCGYVGLPLGAELVRQGHEVFGVRRSVEAEGALKAAGIKPLFADITQRDQLNALPQPFDWVVNTTASSHGGEDDYRSVYLNGARNLIDFLSSAPPKKYVCTSSTSVYGQTDGSQVSETSPTAPVSPIAQILIAAENVLLDAARDTKFPAVILRAAGIYGPERSYYLSQFIKGEAKMTGNGDRFINMIHRDDLVGIIITALKNGRPGEIYNAVDDEPVPQFRFFRWLAETLGMDMPPFIPESLETRKRELTNKKVSNRKLKMELGYPYKYATFRQGCNAEIQRLQELGLL